MVLQQVHASLPKFTSDSETKNSRRNYSLEDQESSMTMVDAVSDLKLVKIAS